MHLYHYLCELVLIHLMELLVEIAIQSEFINGQTEKKYWSHFTDFRTSD
jgi:hypothetical protein